MAMSENEAETKIGKEATVEDLLKLDLPEEYAAAIVRIDVPKDMHFIRVILKDKSAPVGVIGELTSRLRELPFRDATYEGEDFATGNIWFEFENVMDHVKAMCSIVDDYREYYQRKKAEPPNCDLSQ